MAPTAGTPVPGSPGGLVLEHVTKRFVSRAREAVALSDVSLQVTRGEFVSVVGPSGSGKSTLLRIAAGLLDADEGRVAFFDESAAEARRNKHVGYVPQQPALLAWRSVRANVELPFQLNRRAGALPESEARGRAEALLASVGLAALADQLPHELSGGMQQRVAIARALAFEPAALLMDEPFSALDELTREQLRHELLGLVELRHPTALFVTHSIAEAVLLSDRVVVLATEPGRVIGEVAVALPRPRPELVETTIEFLAVENEVRALLRGGAGVRSG